MSTVKANSYYDGNGTSNAVLYGVAAPANSMGFRNRIINGDMRIDQRNAGASVTPTTSNNVFPVDRFVTYASQASKYTTQQNAGSVTPPTGFTNYLGFTSSSAYSIGASDFFLVGQRVEGFNTADFSWGTASAATVTLSFWVRSSLTGTFGGSIRNGGNNYSYPFAFTISSANTWEQKSITIAGPTSGTWATNNTQGLEVLFSLGTGSSNSGTAGVWNTASALFSATGATSVVGTNGATFYITGVQLEAGTVASPFERRDYGRELMMCQRYYQRNPSANVPFGTSPSNYLQQRFFAQATGVYTMTIGASFPVQMRASPTVSLYYDINDGATQGPVAATIAAPTNFTYFIGPPAGTGVDLDDWQASAEL
jgi:hypothetical protein